MEDEDLYGARFAEFRKVYSAWELTRGPIGVTGMVFPLGKFVKTREEEKMDRASQLLVEQRIQEENAKIEAAAEVLVGEVKALDVAQYLHGTIVAFTKTFNGKTYTYAAVRVVTESGSKLWYPTDARQVGGLLDLAFEQLLVRDGGFANFVVLRTPLEAVATE